MSRIFSLKNKWFGYGIYSVLITCVFLYFRFPGADLSDYLDKSIRKVSPSYSFQAESVEPWLPLNLRFSGCKITATMGEDSTLFHSERFIVGPAIWSLFSGERKYVFRGAAYNGEFAGWINLPRNAGRYNAEVQLTDIELGVYTYLQKRIGRSIKGTLNGSVALNGMPARPLDGSGKASLQLSNGSVELQQSFFGFESLELKEAKVESQLKNRRLTTNIEFFGPEFQGKLSGSVRLAKNIMNSNLDLKGAIEPFAELFKNHPELQNAMKVMRQRARNGEITFAVTGTVAKPQIRLI